MRTRIFVAACLVVGVCLFVAVATIGAGPLARRKQPTKPIVVRPNTVINKEAFAPQRVLMAAEVTQPVWSVNVLSKLNLDPEDRALYQDMADALTGVVTVPNDRNTYWSAVGPNIVGWYGSVKGVSADGTGGHTVDVLVAPSVVLNSGESPTVMGNYSERWTVDDDGNATFVQSFDPDGRAGSQPFSSYP